MHTSNPETNEAEFVSFCVAHDPVRTHLFSYTPSFPIIILWFRFRERGRQRRSSQSRSCLSLNLARRFGPSGKAPRCLLFFTFLPSSSQRLDGFSYQGVIVEVVPSPNGAEGKIRVEFADESRKIFKPKELSFIRPEKAFDKVGDLLRSLLTIPL